MGQSLLHGTVVSRTDAGPASGRPSRRRVRSRATPELPPGIFPLAGIAILKPAKDKFDKGERATFAGSC